MKNSLDFIDPTRIGVAIFMTIMLAAMITKPAGASAVYRLDVTYSEGSIKSGPLSFGLSTLPTSVVATFTLGPGQGDIEGDGLSFDDSDVVSASITFGDTTWSRNDLDNFSMTSFATGVFDLNYRFSLTSGHIILNFPLTITGTDEATGQSFKYGYADSDQTLTAIPQILTIAIDIKPGSDPNCFNINGHGVIPVAILGSGDFDVSHIDPASLSFGGLAVRVRGNKGPLCSIEYSNEDAYLDLVCHFEDDASNWDAGDGEAVLTGNLVDGTSFEGTGSICVVP